MNININGRRYTGFNGHIKAQKYIINKIMPIFNFMLNFDYILKRDTGCLYSIPINENNINSYHIFKQLFSIL